MLPFLRTPPPARERSSRAAGRPMPPRPGPPALRRGAAVCVLLAPLLAAGCERLWPTAPHPANLFDSPLAGLTRDELAAFAEGDAQFGRPFAAASGLGPIFNNVSCASCHSGDGRGVPDNVLTRFSRGTDL